MNKKNDRSMTEDESFEPELGAPTQGGAQEGTQQDTQDPQNAGTHEGQGVEADVESEETAAVEASLEEDLMKMREAALRTAAEYDNYRKRVAKEKEDIVRYANERLLEELLPILDNFDMGMQAAKSDESSMIYIGMSMVQRQLEDFLSNQGITLIATNVPFDHNLHEAVSTEVTDASVPEGTILRVVRRGYMLKGKLLRPATVVVSRHASEGENA